MGKLSKDKIFYVYVYLDPRRKGLWECNGYTFHNEPFYVGKGRDNRMYAHMVEYENTYKNKNNKTHRKLHKINKILKEGLYPIIEVVEKNLAELLAYQIEVELINGIKRVEDGGCLFNYRTGGYEGGSLGEDSKRRISESLAKYYKENNLWDYEKDSRIPWNRGIPMTEERKRHLSEINTGKKQDAESVKKRGKSNKKNWDENKEERWNKMKQTMKKNGYVRDPIKIGKAISKTKKGNVIISQKQRNQISNTLKQKYKSGDISSWNKGKVGIQVSTRRKVVVGIDLITNEVTKFTHKQDVLNKFGNFSIGYFIRKQKPFKGYLWMFEEDYKLKHSEV